MVLGLYFTTMIIWTAQFPYRSSIMKVHQVKDNHEIQEWERRLCYALLRWVSSRLRQPDSLFCGGRFANTNYSPFSFPILTSIFAPASRQNILRPVTLPGSVKWTTHHVSVGTSSCNYSPLHNYFSTTVVCIIFCHRKYKYEMFLKSSISILMKDIVCIVTNVTTWIVNIFLSKQNHFP